MIEKIKEWGGVVALVAIIFAGFFGSDPNVGAPVGTRFPNGLGVGSATMEVERNSFHASSTALFTGFAEFFGVVQTDAGVLNSYPNATSSSVATYTLVAADLGANGTCFSFTSLEKTGAVATTTWTYPATSTLSNFLPNTGDGCRQVLAVATSSPDKPGLTLTAGSGWDFETSSTTPTGLTINGGSYAVIDYIRRPDTDIGAAITIFKDAD